MKIFIITRTLSQYEADQLDVNNLPTLDHHNPLSIQRGLKKLNIENQIIKLDDLNNYHGLAPDIIFDCYPPWRGEKDINILRRFQNGKTIFVNDIDVHQKCWNKWTQASIFNKANIAIPKTMKIDLPIIEKDFEIIRYEFGYPLIIKSAFGASGMTVFKCHNEDDVWDKCREIMLTTKYRTIKSNLALAQKWINHKNTLGIIRVTVVGRKASCAERRYPSDPDIDLFISSDSFNESIKFLRHHFVIQDDLRDLVESACSALNIEIAAVDVLHDGKNYLICEVNAPGNHMAMNKQKNVDYDTGLLIAKYLASLK